MATLTYRLVKGSELTYAELDGNFTNLNTAKLELGQAQASGVANGLVYLNGSKLVSTGAGLTFDGTSFTTNGYAAANGLRSLGGNSVRFYNSTNTNWSQIGAPSGTGDMQFDTGAGEQMRLTSTGLGIGTSLPAAKLDVRDALGSVLGQFFENSSGANRRIRFSISSNVSTIESTASTGTTNLAFAVDGLQRLLIDSSGNLGVGVTPSAWISNAKALQVGSFLSAWTGSNGSANLSFGAYEGGAVNTYRYLTTGDAPTMYQQLTGLHCWFTASSGIAGNAITFTQAMTLDASGRLGIGATAPARTLDIRATSPFIRIQETGSGGDKRLELSVDGSGVATISAPQSAQSIAFSTVGSERARITTTGNQIDTQPAESAQNTSVTLTAANLQARVITSNAAVTLTLPTGTTLEGYATNMAVDTAFEVTFVATTANAITIAANGNTTVGSLTVAGNTSGTFRFRKTAANTFTVYRVA